MYDSTKPYTGRIIELVKQTWNTRYVSVNDWFVEKRFDYPEYHHSDGIGTKGVYHWVQKTFSNAVIDALAMNLNDLGMMRATPYAVVDHLFLPVDDHGAVLEIITHLSNYCRSHDIAVTGGETAIHGDMSGLELSINMMGFVKNPRQNLLRNGDVLIGFASSGLHSNGFTKVRELFDEFREDFVMPTNIYLDKLLELDKEYDVHGLMHVTGGAYSKLKSIVSDSDVIISNSHSLIPHQVFFDLYDKGVADEEMYTFFNCGTGFVLGVDKDYVNDLLKSIKGFKACVIGEVVPGKGNVVIDSFFSNKKVYI